MSLVSLIESIRSSFSGAIELNFPLSKCSYYQIGGAASAVLSPKNLNDLLLIQQLISKTQASFFILGWGSNILFSDEGFSGIIIRTKNLFTEISEESKQRLKVGAGIGCSTLLRKAQEKGWGGLSHLTGIPGSVGGMVAMNAGTHLGEFKNCCEEVEIFSFKTGKVRELIPEPQSFSYRHNHFLEEDDVVTHAYLKISSEEPAKIKTEIDELYARRKRTQPVDLPSCGSVFMNPKESGMHAWQVIEKLGLRGERIGNAQISEKHSNFIVNLGGAKASDVKALINLVKYRAQSELGITMKEEVRIL